jgi:oligopeptide transport system substrate-binding protein
MRRSLRVLILLVALALMGVAVVLWQVRGVEHSAGPVLAAGLPRTIDPALASRLDELRLLGGLFEPLVRIDPVTLKPAPALASGWDIAPDRLTWTFHLRPGARWSDGHALTSTDVQRGLQRHLRDGSPYAGVLAGVLAGGRDALARGDLSGIGLSCPDDATLVLRLAAPSPDPLLILALPLFVPATETQAAGTEPWFDPTRVVGNGPLVCVGHLPRHHYDFAPNPRYNGPFPARGPVRVLVVEDAGCALRLYLDGTVDSILAVQPDALRDLVAAGVPVQRSPAFATEFLRVRMTARRADDDAVVTKVLQHPRLRLALARAIDRDTLAKRVLDGLGVPATTFVPPVGAASVPQAALLAYAPDQAKADFAAAVADLGAIPPLTLTMPSTPLDRVRAVEFVIDGWRRLLGVDVRLSLHPTAEVRAREDARAFDLSRGTWLGDFPDAIAFLDVWRADSGVNRTGFADPVYDALLDRAAQAAPAERAVLLQQAETRLLTAVPCIPLVHPTCNQLVRPGVVGIVANPLEQVWLGDVGWADAANVGQHPAVR